MSQDNRLLPLSSNPLDRPLRDLTQSSPIVVTSSPVSSTEPAHLREYLAVVLKRKWLILSLMVVVTSLVAIQMYRLPNIYEAEATIQIEQRRRNVLQTRELVITAPTDPTYWNTQLRLLENPQLARQVILTLDLQNNPSFLGGQASTSILTSVRRIFAGRAPAPAEAAGVPVATDATGLGVDRLTREQIERLEPYEDALRANLIVDPVDKTSLVTLRFRHTDPEIAMRVADTFAEVFRFNDRLRETLGSSEASVQLANQISELQVKIRRLEEQRIAYLRSHNLPVAGGAGSNLTADRVALLSQQLLTAENERKNLEAAYDETTRATDIWSIPRVQAHEGIRQLQQKLRELEQQRAALLEQYTQEWPAVRQLNAQINETKQALETTARAVVAGMRSEYEAARQRVQRTAADYNRELGYSTRQTQDLIMLADLNQQLETNKQIYQTLFQRQQELRLTNADRQDNVSIATQARLPRAPIGPNRERNILVALVLSLGAGVGLAFLLDYLDDTLKSIEDVDRHIHLPTLALIPAPRTERGLLRASKALPATTGVDSTALALTEDVRSPVSEAYRHLRTSLLLSSAGQPPKTVLVTSSQPSEGKTTTAVNTAVTLAQTGAEVLIVDCDLRRPRIHANFGLSNARGLSNYLSGEKDVDSLIQTYEKMPNLKVITSGPVPPNSAELLGSEEMRRFIYQMSERFAHIIIDSPPAISFTDASILSTMVDGVILVVHGGRSSRAVVRRAKQQLTDVGANIYGIVLNNVKLEAQDYYYYSGYYASYYASDEEDGAADEETAATAGARRSGANE